MPATVAAGEVGVSVGSRDYVFRPSFRALASLGDPPQLARLLDSVHVPSRSGFSAALSALYACCDQDPGNAVGYYKGVRERLRYVEKALPWQDVYVLGRKLLINGMVGDPKRARRIKPSDKPPVSFDPSEFAAAATVHLGLGRDDAWDMTMIEFQRAMMIKYPDMVQDLPTPGEYRSAVDTVRRIREQAANG